MKIQSIIEQAKAARRAAANGERPFPEWWLARFDEETLERLAIMTIDGHLTDSQALAALGLA